MLQNTFFFSLDQIDFNVDLLEPGIWFMIEHNINLEYLSKLRANLTAKAWLWIN